MSKLQESQHWGKFDELGPFPFAVTPDLFTMCITFATGQREASVDSLVSITFCPLAPLSYGKPLHSSPILFLPLLPLVSGLQPATIRTCRFGAFCRFDPDTIPELLPGSVPIRRNANQP